MGNSLPARRSSSHAASSVVRGGGQWSRARMRARGGLALLALMVVALLAACGNAGAVGTQPTPTTAIPAGWHLYRDPSAFFTIGLPPGWTAQTVPPSTGVVADKQGSGTITSYEVFFGNPPYDPAGLTVDLSYYPLSNAILRSWSCQNAEHRALGPPTTQPFFAGAGWFVETNTAHFQIGYFVDDRVGQSLAPETPIPQATQDAGARLFARILATFTPTPNTPLQC